MSPVPGVGQGGQVDHAQVVGALRVACLAADHPDGRQEQGGEDGNDRDHHQEFDQGESRGGSQNQLSYTRLHTVMLFIGRPVSRSAAL